MIAAVVLAAGAAARFGSPKQLVPIDGEPMVHRSARLALEAQCRPVCVVVGAHCDQVTLALESLDVCVLEHRQWREGLGSSIAVGVQQVAADLSVDAVLLLPGDLPRLQASTLTRLQNAFDGSPDHCVASAYAGTFGAPALFGRQWFAALTELTGDRGARAVLEAAKGRVSTVDWPDGAHDLDEP